MKIFKQIIVFFVVFTSIAVTAQQVVKIDTLSGNTVKISMDQKISDLLQSAEEKCNKAGNNANSDNMNSDSYATAKINIPERAISTAEACRKNPRILGVKILVNTLRSNEEANQVTLYFRSKFPMLKVTKDASLRPNYKILAGSYFNKSSAEADFRSVKRVFKEARLVSYQIFCVEAK
jgi:hypothetical protein